MKKTSDGAQNSNMPSPNEAQEGENNGMPNFGNMYDFNKFMQKSMSNMGNMANMKNTMANMASMKNVPPVIKTMTKSFSKTNKDIGELSSKFMSLSMQMQMDLLNSFSKEMMSLSKKSISPNEFMIAFSCVIRDIMVQASKNMSKMNEEMHALTNEITKITVKNMQDMKKREYCKDGCDSGIGGK